MIRHTSKNFSRQLRTGWSRCGPDIFDGDAPLFVTSNYSDSQTVRRHYGSDLTSRLAFFRHPTDLPRALVYGLRTVPSNIKGSAFPVVNESRDCIHRSYFKYSYIDDVITGQLIRRLWSNSGSRSAAMDQPYPFLKPNSLS
jgi:hypothetical protein